MHRAAHFAFHRPGIQGVVGLAGLDARGAWIAHWWQVVGQLGQAVVGLESAFHDFKVFRHFTRRHVHVQRFDDGMHLIDSWTFDSRHDSPGARGH